MSGSRRFEGSAMVVTEARPKNQTKRFSLRLRWVLVVVAVLGLALASLTIPARLQRSRVEWIVGNGGRVQYDDQVTVRTMVPVRPARRPRPAPPAPPPPRHAWLRRWVGDDYFRKVSYVRMGWELNDLVMDGVTDLSSIEHLEIKYSRVTGAGLERLGKLPRLRVLNLGYCALLNDDSLAQLSHCPQLTELALTHTRIGDAGVAHLRALTHLEAIYLEGTDVTDAGLKHLYGLKNLRVLDLRFTAVTNEGVAELRRALPQAKVVYTAVNPIWAKMK